MGRLYKYKRKRTTKLKINTSQKAILAYDMAQCNKKKLTSYLQHEKKFIDVNQSIFEINDTGFVHMLNGVAVGDSFTQREGRNTLIKNLWLRFELILATDRASSNVRLMIIKDTMNNGSGLPSLDDILDSVTISSHYDVNNMPQYIKLYDRTWEMADGNHPCFVRQKRITKDIKVSYSNNTADVNSIQKNAIFLVGISDVPTGQNPPEMIYRSRIRFIDN